MLYLSYLIYLSVYLSLYLSIHLYVYKSLSFLILANLVSLFNNFPCTFTPARKRENACRILYSTLHNNSINWSVYVLFGWILCPYCCSCFHTYSLLIWFFFSFLSFLFVHFSLFSLFSLSLVVFSCFDSVISSSGVYFAEYFHCSVSVLISWKQWRIFDYHGYHNNCLQIQRDEVIPRLLIIIDILYLVLLPHLNTSCLLYFPDNYSGRVSSCRYVFCWHES